MPRLLCLPVKPSSLTTLIATILPPKCVSGPFIDSSIVKTLESFYLPLACNKNSLADEPQRSEAAAQQARKALHSALQTLINWQS